MNTFALRTVVAAMLGFAGLVAPEVAAVEASAPVTIKAKDAFGDDFVKVGAGRVLVAGANASGSESIRLSLPPSGTLAWPWVPMVSLADAKVAPEEAARFRLADDAKAGRALVAGPWLAGAWSAATASLGMSSPASSPPCTARSMLTWNVAQGCSGRTCLQEYL